MAVISNMENDKLVSNTMSNFEAWQLTSILENLNKGILEKLIWDLNKDKYFLQKKRPLEVLQPGVVICKTVDLHSEKEKVPTVQMPSGDK